MIGFTPPRWQALKDKWAELPDADCIHAVFWFTDSEGIVKYGGPLLFSKVVGWASEILRDDERRDHTYRADWTERMRDGL